MIFNPTVIASGGGSSTELVSVTFNYGPTSLYLFYTTVENGNLVVKSTDSPGQTIQAVKGSLIFACAPRTYSVLLEATGASSLANFEDVSGDRISINGYSLDSRDTFNARIYEATG